MAGFVYRRADRGDIKGLFAALESVAQKIPLRLDGDERQRLILDLISECVDTDESWVTGDGERIIGFALARPALQERFFNDNDSVELAYAGVIATAQNRGVFTLLFKNLSERRAPIYATVKHANQSHMGDRLRKLGFAQIGGAALPDEDRFLWQPA
jgi:hypothetical protein